MSEFTHENYRNGGRLLVGSAVRSAGRSSFIIFIIGSAREMSRDRARSRARDQARNARECHEAVIDGPLRAGGGGEGARTEQSRGKQSYATRLYDYVTRESVNKSSTRSSTLFLSSVSFVKKACR